jgi:hypothetical protein
MTSNRGAWYGRVLSTKNGLLAAARIGDGAPEATVVVLGAQAPAIAATGRMEDKRRWCLVSCFMAID